MTVATCFAATNARSLRDTSVVAPAPAELGMPSALLTIMDPQGIVTGTVPVVNETVIKELRCPHC